ncbi:uncharacterized protein LOC127851876 [Dreissena polymorpha]|uniref:uncharacterized protein LOC127851876 n=1 Tax=Dreissena polymorpha TaxID=45954 RepID=UPI002265222E|nr:uncharacterized protein LOC127851876 [Dreissena polymorpha]
MLWSYGLGWSWNKQVNCIMWHQSLQGETIQLRKPRNHVIISSCLPTLKTLIANHSVCSGSICSHRLSIPLVQDPQSTDANRRNKTGQSATQPVAAVVTILTPVKTRSSETISNTASCSSCYRMTPVKTRSSETISNTASCSSCYHIDPSQK